MLRLAAAAAAGGAVVSFNHARHVAPRVNDDTHVSVGDEASGQHGMAYWSRVLAAVKLQHSELIHTHNTYIPHVSCMFSSTYVQYQVP